MAQTRDGALWLATAKGLLRYDGYHVTRLTTRDGLVSDNVVSLVKAGETDELWVGTEDGLCRYDGEQLDRFAVPASAPIGRSPPFMPLLERADGTLLVGTNDGLYRHERGSLRRLASGASLVGRQVLALLEDHSGCLWVGTPEGLYRRSPDGFKLVLDTRESLGAVRCLVEGRNGTLWVGGSSGLYHSEGDGFVDATSSVGLQTGTCVTCLHVDRKGDLWIGTRGWGVVFRHHKHDWTSHRHMSRRIGCLFEDREGSLWCGGELGIWRYFGDTFAGWRDDVNCAVETPDGVVWLGTTKGILRLEEGGKSQRRLGPPEGLTGWNVSQILLDTRGTLWVGSTDGVHRLDGEELSVFGPEQGLETGRVAALEEDNQGRVWIAMGGGVSVWDGTSLKTFTRKVGLVNNYVRVLLKDREGRMWIGTRAGLSLYDGKTFRNFTTQDGLVHDLIHSLLQDRAGKIWIGTQHGVTVYDGTAFTDLRLPDELTVGPVPVHAIMEDSRGHLWIGTTDTVYRYDGFAFQSLRRADGMASSRGAKALLEDHRGNVWIASVDGLLTRFSPPATAPSLVKIVDLASLLPSHPSEDILRQPDQRLDLQILGLSYRTRHGCLLYRYRLLGHDDEWRLSRSGLVDYRDVPRGTYTLEAQAIDRDLNYSEPIRRRIRVVLPAGQALLWLGLGAAVLVAFGLTHQLIRRNRDLRAAQDRLENRVDERTIELEREITERKEKERALRESEEKFSKVFETSPASITISTWDEGRVLAVNEAFESASGFRREEIVGLTAAEHKLWKCPEDRERILKLLREKRSVRNLEQPWVNRDGATRLSLLSAGTVSIADQQCIVWVEVDITERVRAEQEAQRHRERLIEADKLIALGTLVSGVAHEVNNPNQLIVLNTPILREAWKDIQPLLEDHARKNSDFRLANVPYSEMRDEVPQLIDDIRKGADRIRFIISELKEYASEQNRTSLEPVSLNDVVRSALTLIAEPIRRATNRFSADLSTDLPEVRGNHRRLEQVVINLILNACQALPASDKAIEVSTRGDRRAGIVTLTVRDEGCGIAEKDLGHILDPFFTTKRDSGGVGLGLSVAARIIEQHRGSLEFTSEHGKGTIAEVTLPVDPRRLPDLTTVEHQSRNGERSSLSTAVWTAPERLTRPST